MNEDRKRAMDEFLKRIKASRILEPIITSIEPMYSNDFTQIEYNVRVDGRIEHLATIPLELLKLHGVDYTEHAARERDRWSQ